MKALFGDEAKRNVLNQAHELSGTPKVTLCVIQ
jgi:hypothetical protein